jgi:ring-1,2-phenylacetyl-CoA epoxidase subunit PaaC
MSGICEPAVGSALTLPGIPRLTYVLARADDALILGHRLSEWTGHAPMLEEEMALANLALDLIGQARLLYAYAGTIEGAGHDEDDFAYFRDPGQFRNLLLVEQPNGDFATTMMRHFLYAAFADPYWRAMMAAGDETLAAIAAKAEKEIAYHLRHAGDWVIRLGGGTAESHRRVSAALELLWPFTGEMFLADEAETALSEAGAVIAPAALRPRWEETIDRVFAAAGLTRPTRPWVQSGGRQGRHSEHLGHLLAVMQHLARSHPGARW